MANEEYLTFNSIVQPIGYEFVPLMDITAYEIASLFTYFFDKPMFKPDWENLGTAKRHLRLVR